MVYIRRYERKFTIMVPKTVECTVGSCFCCRYQSVALFGQHVCRVFGEQIHDGKRCQECLDAERDTGDDVDVIDESPKEVPA